MAATAKRTNPELWDAVKQDVQAGAKGGAAGEWSARKAQLAVHEYKKRGGGYAGSKDPHNHLVEWGEKDWGTRSGKPSGETHERYLPKEAREALTDAEYARTTAKKRADTAKGRQFSPQPEDVARKTTPFRHSGSRGPTKAAMMLEARRRGIPGRSRMSKADLAAAIA